MQFARARLLGAQECAAQLRCLRTGTQHGSDRLAGHQTARGYQWEGGGTANELQQREQGEEGVLYCGAVHECGLMTAGLLALHDEGVCACVLSENTRVNTAKKKKKLVAASKAQENYLTCTMHLDSKRHMANKQRSYRSKLGLGRRGDCHPNLSVLVL